MQRWVEYVCREMLVVVLLLYLTAGGTHVISSDLVNALAGREMYGESLQWISGGIVVGWRSLIFPTFPSAPTPTILFLSPFPTPTPTSASPVARLSGSEGAWTSGSGECPRSNVSRPHEGVG
ncbi:hypothetical protein E2C01_012871 [Portunus trituberculatus]|uniref:Uncharacterized protein n=1 Tax=Portunus trituberculatus TaxID=210409 RepID=A0A5B7DES3_PORTR|nr:hypothetical protein [Portunus trituberculatus]